MNKKIEIYFRYKNMYNFYLLQAIKNALRPITLLWSSSNDLRRPIYIYIYKHRLCKHICEYPCICIYVFIRPITLLCNSSNDFRPIYMYVYMYICIIYVYLCVYTYTYSNIIVWCISVYIDIYVYIYTMNNITMQVV
jgi:hypothetical protein